MPNHDDQDRPCPAPYDDDDQRAHALAIAENVASIARVPHHILAPHTPARAILLTAARLGLDVYCYASGGELTGTWCAWIEDRRIPLDDTPALLLSAMGALTRAANASITGTGTGTNADAASNVRGEERPQ